MSATPPATSGIRLHRCGRRFGLGNPEPPWLGEGSTHVGEAAASGA